MPGFASHYLFGQESLSHLKEDREFHTLSLHPHAFNLGLQGPDVFYYYLPAWLLYDKNIASHIHGEASLQFFIAMLDARNQLSKHSHRIIADAYICGFLGHYTLDTYCHPYIFARTHHLQNKDRNGGLYDFGRHVFLETGIDQEMISHFLHCKPTDFRPGDTIALSPKERRVIAKVLAFAIAKVYPDAAMPKWQIRGACRAMKIESRLMHDPSGIKKRIVRRLEAIFVKVPVISPMIPSDTLGILTKSVPKVFMTCLIWRLRFLQTAYMLTLVLSVSAPMSPWKIFTTPEIPSWKNTAIYLIIQGFHYQYVKTSLR